VRFIKLCWSRYNFADYPQVSGMHYLHAARKHGALKRPTSTDGGRSKTQVRLALEKEHF